MTTTPGTLAGVIAAIAITLSGPGTASAQTCNVTGGQTWYDTLYVGKVEVFGDLKVRVVSRSETDQNSWIEIDLKSPTGQLNGVRLMWGSPAQKFTMCGQEVSIGYDGGWLTVGVF